MTKELLLCMIYKTDLRQKCNGFIIHLDVPRVVTSFFSTIFFHCFNSRIGLAVVCLPPSSEQNAGLGRRWPAHCVLITVTDLSWQRYNAVLLLVNWGGGEGNKRWNNVMFIYASISKACIYLLGRGSWYLVQQRAFATMVVQKAYYGCWKLSLSQKSLISKENRFL